MKYFLGIILMLIFALQSNALIPAPFLLRIVKNKALDIIDKAKIGKDECYTNLKSLITDLGNFKSSWALKMIDASAKLQTGILTGNIHQIGNFDQCLNVREDRGKFGIVEGQYCTVSLTPSKNYTSNYGHLPNIFNFIEWATGLNMEDQHIIDLMKYHKSTFGLCLPKSCNAENLQVVWDYIEKTFRMPVHVQIKEAMCSYKGKDTFPFAIDKYILTAKRIDLSPWILLFHMFASCIVGYRGYWNNTYYMEIICMCLKVTRREDLCLHHALVITVGIGILCICSHPTYIRFFLFSTFFGVFAALLVISTMYDLLVHQYLKDKNEINIWTSFSMYSNCKQLLKISKGDRDSSLDCIAGIKTLCMISVVFGHKFAMMAIMGNVNSVDLIQLRTQFRNGFLLSVHYSVDTFLVLSGMMLTYLYIKSKETILKNRPFPLLPFYFYRFLRLWPGLIAVILFYVGVLKYTGDGPFWPAAMYKAAPICKATGWATALFMTNMITFPYQCMEQAWYLSVDTQLYMISPVVLINLYKHPKTTSFICTLLCILSVVYVFVITNKYQYGHSVFESSHDYHDYVYQPTYTRMPAWFIGVFLGYLFYYYKNVSIPKGLNVFIWIVTAALMMSLIFVHTVLAKNGYNKFYAALYNSLVRPLWALGTSVIIFLCSTGHAEALNRFLSHKVFKLVAKLSYDVYLVHIGFQGYIASRTKTFSHFSTFNIFHQFMADLFFILGVAILWCLAFEAPFINIARIMLKKELPKRQGESSKQPSKQPAKQQKNQKLKKEKPNTIKVYESVETKKII